jgi:hypothetical protein
LVLWVARVSERRDVRSLSSVHLAYLGYTVLSIAGIAWTSAPDRGVTTMLNYVLQFVAMYVLWDIGRQTNWIDRWLQAYVTGALVVSIAVILRIGDSGASPNFVGLTIAFALPLGLYLLKQRGWTMNGPNVLTILFGPLGVTGVALTGSRQSFVVALLGLTVYPFLSFSSTRSVTNAASGTSGIVVCAVVTTVAISDKLARRLLSIPRDVLGVDLPSRMLRWQAGLEYYFAGNLLLGRGTGAAKYVVWQELGVLGRMDNTYVSALVNYGLLGLLALGGVYLVLLRDGVRFDGDYADLLLTFFIIIVVLSFVQETLLRVSLWLLPSLLIAGCYNKHS